MHRFRATLSHLHLKFERNVIFILLFIFFIAGFFTSEYLVSKDLKALLAEKKQCQTQLEKSGDNQTCLSDQDLRLYMEKEKALEKVSVSHVAFTSRINSLSNTKKEVVLSLQGNPSMKIDAADFAFSFPNTVKVISITPGQAFPAYPRKVMSKNGVVISGIVSLKDNAISYGQLNKPFATVIVEKMGPPAQEETLTVDTKNTKIFFQGVSVLDEERSITKIQL